MEAWQGLDIPPDQLAVGLSVILCALVLNRFTAVSGITGLLVNAAALFVGAELSLWLTANLELPLDHVIERTLLLAFAGMAVAAVAVMVVMSQLGGD